MPSRVDFWETKQALFLIPAPVTPVTVYTLASRSHFPELSWTALLILEWQRSSQQLLGELRLISHETPNNHRYIPPQPDSRGLWVLLHPLSREDEKGLISHLLQACAWGVSDIVSFLFGSVHLHTDSPLFFASMLTNQCLVASMQTNQTPEHQPISTQ